MGRSSSWRMGHVWNSCIDYLGLYLACGIILLLPTKAGALKHSLATIHEAGFIKSDHDIFTNGNWTRLERKQWEHIDLADLWESFNHDHKYRNPRAFYSSVFGFVVAEQRTFQEFAYPDGRYWNDLNMLEENCLCSRRNSPIRPALSFTSLNKTVRYFRSTGHSNRFLWIWEDFHGPLRDLYLKYYLKMMREESRWLEQKGAVQTGHKKLKSHRQEPKGKLQQESKALLRGLTALQRFVELAAILKQGEDDRDEKGRMNESNGDMQWQDVNVSKVTDEQFRKLSGHKLKYWKVPVELKRSKSQRQFTMTRYKSMIIHLLETFSIVEASCSERIVERVAYSTGQVDWNEMKFISFARWNFWVDRYKNDSRPKEFLRTECSFAGSELSFEPFELAFIVQEIDRYATRYNFNWYTTDYTLSPNLYAPSVASWKGKSQPPFSNRTKWIDVGSSVNQTRDSQRAVLKPGRLKVYSRYPTMLKSDNLCLARTRRRKECKDPVTGTMGKIAFWQRVKLDVSENVTRFPGHPIRLLGAGKIQNLSAKQKRIMDMDVQSRKRSKRFLGTLAAMIFGAINRADLETLKLEVRDIRSEMRARFSDIMVQLDSRFQQQNNRLRALAGSLNALQISSYVESQNLYEIIKQILRGRQLANSRMDLLETEVTELQKMSLKQLDFFLREVRSVELMTSSELAIDTLIIESLQGNITAKKLFDRSKAHLVQMQHGVLHLKEIAQRIQVEKQGWNVTIQKEMDLSKSLRDRTRKANEKLGLVIKVWSGDALNKSRLVLLNISEWNYSNLTWMPWNNVQYNYTNLGSLFSEVGIIAKAAGKGLVSVVKGVVNTAGDLLGSTTRGLMSGLVPLAALAAVLVITCCLIQNYPGCARAKQSLPAYLRTEDSNRVIEEANKVHSLGKFTTEGTELAAML